MTKSTITRERVVALIEEHSYDSALVDALEHLLSAMDSEPVKRVNADQMHHVCLEANRHLDKYGAMAKEVNKLLGRIPAQPAPVVADYLSIFEAAIEECKKCDSIDEHAWNHGVLAVIAKYESCRAAMLNGGNDE